MNVQRQRLDGSWESAEPLEYTTGYDAERYRSGNWVLFRNTARASVPVASGRTTIGLLFAYWWRRVSALSTPDSGEGGRP